MERIKAKDVLILVLIAVLIGSYLKPDNSLNEGVMKRIEESIQKQDSIIQVINKLNTKRNELKDSINSVDSTYIDLDKNGVRSRVRHLMSSN